MAREPIPDDIQRFILMTVTSVPYLEAMLLLHNEPMRKWAHGVVRPLAYGLILYAVIDKNWIRKK